MTALTAACAGRAESDAAQRGIVDSPPNNYVEPSDASVSASSEAGQADETGESDGATEDAFVLELFSSEIVSDGGFVTTDGAVCLAGETVCPANYCAGPVETFCLLVGNACRQDPCFFPPPPAP